MIKNLLQQLYLAIISVRFQNINKSYSIVEASSDNKDRDVGYLLNNDWFEKWKIMHYFESYSQNLKPEYDEYLSKEIKPISNDELIRAQSEFYTDEDPKSYLNYILKPNIKMNVHYRPIHKDIWRFFHSKYGGTEIKRFYYKTHGLITDIEVKLKEIKVVILPHLEAWNIRTIKNPKSIFVSKYDKLNTLLERLEKILNSTGKFNLSQDTMRAWKLAFHVDLEKIDHDIKTAIEQNIEVEEFSKKEGNAEDSSNKNIENNTGVKFPGT